MRRPLPPGVLASPASRGLAPHEGLALLVLKMGHTRPSMEPRGGLQVGNSGYPGSQNIDSSPRAQGALRLSFEAKPKGKGEAPRPLTTCGPGRHVALDGTWAPLLPHEASATVLDWQNGWRLPPSLHCLPFVLLQIPFSPCLERLQICRTFPQACH